MRNIINRMGLVISCILLFVFFPLLARSSHAGWAATYGGSNPEYAKSIQQTSDGGYIMAGWGQFNIDFRDDFWVLKLNSSGSIQWQKYYEIHFSNEAYSILQTTDGGYIVAGKSESFTTGNKEILLLKLNSSGNIQWQKAYVGTRVVSEVLPIQQTTDGGYIVAGTIYWSGPKTADFLILKLNSSGNIQWRKTYDAGSSDDRAWSIQQTSDSGYIIAGITRPSSGAGDPDFLVLKLNSDGSVEWRKTYGGADDDGALSLRQTSDGGYIVAGYTDSFGVGGPDFWVLKLSSTGNVLWEKTYGGTGSEQAYSIRQTSDGGYVVAGWTSSFGAGSSDFWVLKLSSSGSVQWEKTYGGSGWEEAQSIQQTTDGGYIVTGWTSSFGAGSDDIWVLKLEPDGSIYAFCNFITGTSASVADSDATVTTPALIVSGEYITVEPPEVTVINTSVSPVYMCKPPYLLKRFYPKKRFFLKIKWLSQEGGQKSIKGSLGLCIDQDFCNAIMRGPEEIVLEINECYRLIVPGEMLRPNRKGTKFRAVTSTYKLKVDCSKNWLSLRLKNITLSNCIDNPVKFCAFIDDSSSLCAEEEFEEKRDKTRRLKKLTLMPTGGECSP